MDPNMNMATPGPMPQPQPAPQPQPISQPTPQPMSQPTPMTNPTFPPSAPSADKGDKTFKIATIIASVIALAGIGFGAYGMVQNSQKDTDISNLKTQVQNLNNALADAENNASTTTPDNTISNTTTENTQDYIYVGEWGIKIKIPENLQNVSYEVVNHNDDISAYTSVVVTGATTGHGDQKPSFIRSEMANSMSVGVIKYTKIPENDERLSGMVDKYIIQGPQAVFGDGTDTDWEVESINALKEMLSPDNFTKI